MRDRDTNGNSELFRAGFEEDHMGYDDLKTLVLATAREMTLRGRGWAQESVVLRAVKEKLPLSIDLDLEQEVLRAWHDLFLERKLAWGYNLDNPNSPFFHVRQERERTVATA
jgi:hypothetical protein